MVLEKERIMSHGQTFSEHNSKAVSTTKEKFINYVHWNETQLFNIIPTITILIWRCSVWIKTILRKECIWNLFVVLVYEWPLTTRA